MPKGHAVVDGSNLATEGRSEPSLAQLDEAVAAFTSDHNFAHVTVVVDASFEHRVTKREQTAAKKAIDEGRIITPPAGVVGRGDTFILQIADRAGAIVLSNDSFQEFHGQYKWLFDDGRLIGGKPVPHVGWVFVPRRPVRGPTSREAVRRAEKKSKTGATTTAEPATKKTARRSKAKKAPAGKAPAAASTRKSRRSGAAKAESTGSAETGGGRTPARKRAAKQTGTKTNKKTAKKTAGTAAKRTTKKTAKKTAGKSRAEKKPTPTRTDGTDGNDGRRKSGRGGFNPVRTWRRFRRDHPVGSSVEATVERFSSHGAHASTADGVSAYLPSSLLGDPPPTRARDVVAEGASHTFVVHEYDEDTRGVVLGLVPVESPRSSSRH